MSPVFAYLFGAGPYELLIVGFVALLLFGSRLPSVMRNLGKGITEFKKGVQGIEDETDKADETPKLEKEAAEKMDEK